MTVHARGWIFALLGALLLSSGCASRNGGHLFSTTPQINVLPLPATLTPGSGLVVMNMASNVAGLSGLLVVWNGLDVYRVDDGRGYRLAATRQGLIGSVAFLGELPPGEYRVEQVTASDASNGLTLPLANWGSTFRVDAGHLTNLGTLVFQPQSNDLTVKGSKFYLGYERNTGEVGGYLRATQPQLAASVTGTTLEWTSIDGLEARRTLASRVRRAALGNYNIAIAKDGTLYSTAQFGTVRRRDAEGHWTQSDTGNTRRMISVCVLTDGTVLAGGEAGLLLRSDDRGRSWKPIPAPKPQFAVFDLGQLPDGSVYTLSPTDDGHVLVHLSDARLKLGWRQIGDFALRPSTATIPVNALPDVTSRVSAGRLILFLAPQTLEVYVGGKAGWAARPVPSAFEQSGIDRENRLYLIAHKDAPAKNSRDVVLTSTDAGSQWTEAFTFNHSRETVLLSGTGLLFRVASTVISESPYKTENRLAATNDRGKTWRDLGSFTLGYPRLVTAPGGVLLAVFANVIYASQDGGLHWAIEVEQFRPPAETDGHDTGDRKAIKQETRYCPRGACAPLASPSTDPAAAPRLLS